MSIKTITLNPIADAYVGTGITTNNGNQSTLFIGRATTDPVDYETLIKFDFSCLSCFPGSSHIISAVLYLYVTSASSSPLPVSAFLNTSDFLELTVVNSNKPTTGTVVSSAPITVSSTNVNSYIGIDITSAISDWVTTSSPNYGITLKDPTVPPASTSLVRFSSREVAVFKPFLNITYNDTFTEALTVPATGIQSTAMFVGDAKHYSFYVENAGTPTSPSGSDTIGDIRLQLSADGISYVEYSVSSLSTLLPLTVGNIACIPLSHDINTSSLNLPYAKYARLSLSSSSTDAFTTATITFVAK